VSSYGKLAEIYDAIYHLRDYRKDVGYLLEQIRGQHPSARTLLDIACGTGNHIEVLKEHFECEGLDLSGDMLAIARRKFPDVPFHEASMVQFSLGRAFDVIICLFSSIAHVKTAENLTTSLCTMARHLQPGGLLMVEPYFTPESYWVGDVKLNEAVRPDVKIAWMSVSKRSDLLSLLELHYLVGTAQGVQHFTETHELGLFTREDFQRAFDAAGMSFTYDPVGPAKRGFYIGRKTA
jgi:2-polyprenyl-3-methyl-5-hydroxy-6-metoxy-1,4-benzoquinol methylase